MSHKRGENEEDERPGTTGGVDAAGPGDSEAKTGGKEGKTIYRYE